jgi:hypothetical protein
MIGLFVPANFKVFILLQIPGVGHRRVDATRAVSETIDQGGDRSRSRQTLLFPT